MARILLAEDDHSMRDFLSKALKRAGHEVEPVGDGEEGLEALGDRAGVFDLLLTDIVMPGVDGIELARRAAEIDPGLKIMFITGFAAVALNVVDGISSMPFLTLALDDALRCACLTFLNLTP